MNFVSLQVPFLSLGKTYSEFCKLRDEKAEDWSIKSEFTDRKEGVSKGIMRREGPVVGGSIKASFSPNSIFEIEVPKGIPLRSNALPDYWKPGKSDICTSSLFMDHKFSPKWPLETGIFPSILGLGTTILILAGVKSITRPIRFFFQKNKRPGFGSN